MKNTYSLPVKLITLIMFISCLANANESPVFIVNANPVLLKQLKIEQIQFQNVADSLRLSARVELDQKRVARIGASVSGRVTEINAELGQSVKMGERLALINSNELGKAQSDYLKASSQVNLRRLAVQRAERLLNSDVIAAAELQDRQGILNEAEVDLKAVSDQLRIMGMNEKDLQRLSKDRSIYSFSPVTSNIEGIIIERHIMLGEVVQPTDSLFTVANLSQLWLVAEVPEQQAHWAREGDQVQAEIPALPDSLFNGQLIYVADLVNPETRTVTVRMALANPKRLLKPQMLATLKISKLGSQLLVVPSQAVVRDNDEDYVFVQIENSRFELRPVRLGHEENSVRPVLNGLKMGDLIVTDGAFHLNNERLRGNLE